MKIKKEVGFKQLKTLLYHGTKRSLIDKILSDGLKTMKRPVHKESIKQKGIKEGNNPPRIADYGVYLTSDLEGAMLYAYDASKNCPPEFLEECDADLEDMCVVVIDKIPKNVKVGSDGFGDLMTNDKNIPPNS